MNMQVAGQTPHFTVSYDADLGAPSLAVANAVLVICEVNLFTLSRYMPYMRGGGGDPFLNPTIDVQIINNPLGGPPFASADNNGFRLGQRSQIRINPFSAAGVTITNDYAGMVFVAEMAEILMGGYNWDLSSSQGEALSRVMAEELHPASATNWVNSWLGWPRPRPDWISRNEFTTPGIFVRADLDPVAYGCGIIFIYFLRYQLGFTYDQICMAGGSLLSDRYRILTGATDDPAARVNSLLDRHFGAAPFNLVGNNPFPLLEGADRKVILGFTKSSRLILWLTGSGHAHVKPFFNCPAADYAYSDYSSNVTWTITASTLGIGLPGFTWHINGQTLTAASRVGDTVPAQVDVPDPQNPDHPKRQTQTFTFDYQITTASTAAGTTSILRVTSRSLHGSYQIDVRVDADETAVPTSPVTAQQGLTFQTRTIVYGGSYDADRQRCAQVFEHAAEGKLRSVHTIIDYLHNLPDPPQPGYRTRVLEAAAEIREELARVAETDHAAATEMALYAAHQLGVPAHLFLKGARGTSA
jgi:hypothetical protein